MLCWSYKIKSSWWQFAYFTGLLINIFFFLPGVNVRCKVLKASWEGDTRGMHVSSFKLLSSFLLSISLPQSTELYQLWKVTEKSIPRRSVCLNWSFEKDHQPVISYQHRRRFRWGKGKKSLQNRAWNKNEGHFISLPTP